eukprot:TRINITY_DN3802_c0_g1_i14.p1 TRINITY_DN3802_c0_g1~~TRINITY_DN3802_c0_g1_i14.p1  ORF type:complete len:513 (+),score=103.91 TRINITY_DN3802_c0_g1_i14:953-2491(+)
MRKDSGNLNEFGDFGDEGDKIESLKSTTTPWKFLKSSKKNLATKPTKEKEKSFFQSETVYFGDTDILSPFSWKEELVSLFVPKHLHKKSSEWRKLFVQKVEQFKDNPKTDSFHHHGDVNLRGPILLSLDFGFNFYKKNIHILDETIFFMDHEEEIIGEKNAITLCYSFLYEVVMMTPDYQRNCFPVVKVLRLITKYGVFDLYLPNDPQSAQIIEWNNKLDEMWISKYGKELFEARRLLIKDFESVIYMGINISREFYQVLAFETTRIKRVRKFYRSLKSSFILTDTLDNSDTLPGLLTDGPTMDKKVPSPKKKKHALESKTPQPVRRHQEERRASPTLGQTQEISDIATPPTGRKGLVKSPTQRTRPKSGRISGQFDEFDDQLDDDYLGFSLDSNIVNMTYYHYCIVIEEKQRMFAIPLRFALLMDDGDLKFRVVTDKKTYLFEARNAHTKKIWFESIGDGILKTRGLYQPKSGPQEIEQQESEYFYSESLKGRLSVRDISDDRVYTLKKSG